MDPASEDPVTVPASPNEALLSVGLKNRATVEKEPESEGLRQESLRVVREQQERLRALLVQLETKETALRRAVRKAKKTEDAMQTHKERYERVVRALEESRRAVHEANHEQKISEQERDLAAKARNKLEKVVTRLRETLADVQREKSDLMIAKQALEQKLFNSTEQMKKFRADHSRIGQDLDFCREELRKALKEQSELEDGASRAEILQTKLDEANQRYETLELALEEERANVLQVNAQIDAVKESVVNLERRNEMEVQLRADSQSRVETVEKQLEAMRQGSHALIRKAAEVENLRELLRESRQESEELWERLQSAGQESDRLKGLLQRQREIIDGVQPCFQRIQSRISQICSQGQPSDGPELDFVSSPWISQNLEPIFDSLDAVQNILLENLKQCQLQKKQNEILKVKVRNVDQANARMDAERRRVHEEHDDLEHLLSQREGQLASCRENLELSNTVLSATQLEMEKERSAHSRIIHGIRKTLLRCHFDCMATDLCTVDDDVEALMNSLVRLVEAKTHEIEKSKIERKHLEKAHVSAKSDFQSRQERDHLKSLNEDLELMLLVLVDRLRRLSWAKRFYIRQLSVLEKGSSKRTFRGVAFAILAARRFFLFKGPCIVPLKLPIDEKNCILLPEDQIQSERNVREIWPGIASKALAAHMLNDPQVLTFRGSQEQVQKESEVLLAQLRQEQEIAQAQLDAAMNRLRLGVARR